MGLLVAHYARPHTEILTVPAAGILFLSEAGGVATHWDGKPFRVGSPSPGVLLAHSAQTHALMSNALSPLLLDDLVRPELQTA